MDSVNKDELIKAAETLANCCTRKFYDDDFGETCWKCPLNAFCVYISEHYNGNLGEAVEELKESLE